MNLYLRVLALYFLLVPWASAQWVPAPPTIYETAPG